MRLTKMTTHDLTQQVSDLFFSAVKYQWTSGKLNAEVKERVWDILYGNVRTKHFTRAEVGYVKGFVYGCYACMWHHMEFLYELPDGTLGTCEEYQAKNPDSLSFPGKNPRHYYKGTRNPY